MNRHDDLEISILDQWLENRSKFQFKSEVKYYKEGDFASFFKSDERCIAEQIDPVLTVYRSNATNEIIGWRINGVSKLMP